MSKVANVGKLAGHTLFISGASRGIGLEVAKKAAADGANIVVAAKTAKVSVTSSWRNNYVITLGSSKTARYNLYSRWWNRKGWR